ncbi:MAG: hypothetical protein E7305_00590 [Butyrivibrio sp.]|nr:hypothetical protein [Butyrivibrio sp.]
MKKRICVMALATVMLFFASLVVLDVPTTVEAAEMTYSGTVSEKTTSDVLYLSTSGGTVQIKIDGGTEFSNAKFLLPGNSITANCYVGTDEYWHASKLTGNSSAGKVSVDTANKATVKGRIAKGTSEDLLYLVVDNGTMQIKLDGDTDLSGCRFLIVGKTVSVTCARGSDAYMHAMSISDVGGSTGSSSGSSVGTASGNSVTGTVEKGTTSSILFLETSGGTMQFVLDLATDASECRTLIPGQSVTVTFYRGSDAWNHSSKMVNNTAKAASETTLSGDRTTVTGRVTGETKENTLFLDTDGGTMQIRLDASTNFSRCPVLLVDKKVEVVVSHGSDEYLHAVAINAK